MVEKQVALDILQEIKLNIQEENSGTKAIKNINLYIKNFEIATNSKIKALVKKQKETMAKYGEDDKHTIKINKKISEEMSKIYNK